MLSDDEYKFDDEGPDAELNNISRSIIGAAIAVHKELGPGHLESAYEAAMAIEFAYREIPFNRQMSFELRYRNQVVGESRMDFLVAARVIVDLKAKESISAADRKQMISYLKITRQKLGLIINFNVPVLIQGVYRFAN